MSSSSSSSSSSSLLSFFFPPCKKSELTQAIAVANTEVAGSESIPLSCFFVGETKEKINDKDAGGKPTTQVQKLWVEFQCAADVEKSAPCALDDARKNFVNALNTGLQQLQANASSPAASSSSSSSSSSSLDPRSLLHAYRFYYRDDEGDWLQLTNEAECLAFLLFAHRFQQTNKDDKKKQPILCIVNHTNNEELASKAMNEIIQLPIHANEPAIQASEPHCSTGCLVAASQFSMLPFLQISTIRTNVSLSSSSHTVSSSFPLVLSHGFTLENCSCVAFPENSVLLLSVALKDTKIPIMMAAYSIPRLEVGESLRAYIDVDCASLLLLLENSRVKSGGCDSAELSVQLGGAVPSSTADAYLASSDVYLAFTFGSKLDIPFQMNMGYQPARPLAAPSSASTVLQSTVPAIPAAAPASVAAPRSAPIPVDDAFPTGGVDVFVTADGISYDVCLVNFGSANNNKFYKIQLLRSRLNGCLSLWCRWGRVGVVGAHSCFNFGEDQLRAREAFEKSFQEQTGNLWQDRKAFIQQPGKYIYLEELENSCQTEDVERVPIIPPTASSSSTSTSSAAGAAQPSSIVAPAASASSASLSPSSVSSESSPDAAVRYIAELNELRSMGFSDEKLCLFLVHKYRGDLNAVVDWLMRNEVGNKNTKVINVSDL